MIYQINKENVLFQTRSHTLVNSLLETESIKEEKSLEKYKHIVTRSISGKPSESSIDISLFSFPKMIHLLSVQMEFTIRFPLNRFLCISIKENGIQQLEREFLKDSQDNYSIITIGF